MDLNRGILARIDRRLLAGLGQDEGFQMVRVPVTEAQWATWKRHCNAAGVSMGRGVAALIEHELLLVLGDSIGLEFPVLARRAEEQMEAREAQVDARESAVNDAEEHVRILAQRLRDWEGRLEAREGAAESAPGLVPRPTRATAKVGRNEPCPCGSGAKYKRCHG